MKKHLKIVVTGGGTGGHTEPIIAVVRALQQKIDFECLWIGENNGREEVVAREKNIAFIGIHAGKIRRYMSLRNVTDPLKVALGFFEAKAALRAYKPDIIFSKAGYVAAPVVLAARSLKIPIVIHESDTVLGLTNKVSAYAAEKVCVGFPEHFYPRNLRKKLVYTGNPVFDLVKVEKAGAYNMLGIPDDKPVIAIFGGSQGSLAINETIWRTLDSLTNDYVVIHQVGANHIEHAQKIHARLSSEQKKNYVCAAYYSKHDMSAILSVAKAAIGRAGAGTIADVSFFGVPTIFIPLPNSGGDHQALNARFLTQHDAAVVVPESSMTSEVIQKELTKVMSSTKKLDDMSKAIAKINPRDAAQKIAQEIIVVASNHG